MRKVAHLCARDRRSRRGAGAGGARIFQSLTALENLAMGRALMSEPRHLLLDEASTGLAPVLVDSIFDTIRAVNARGVTSLLVEQNAAMALETARRGYVLETGAIALAGGAAELRGNAQVRAAYLGEAQARRCCAGERVRR